MAGKSGLNLTKDEPLEPFLHRFGEVPASFRDAVCQFGPEHIAAWAKGLGQPVFTGSTRRVFPKAMKASPLLRAWVTRLSERGVRVVTRCRWTGWQGAGLRLDTTDGPKAIHPGAVIFALGGASWKRLGSDAAWVEPFTRDGIAVNPFVPANVGFRIDWSDHMRPHFGTPIKSTCLTADTVTTRGEWVIAASGIEGGGVYEVSMAVRDGAPLLLDLLPDLTVQEAATRLAKTRTRESLMNRLRKGLALSPAARSLAQEWGRPLPSNAVDLAKRLKALPVPVQEPMPMDQAISTGGGVAWDMLDGFMLRSRPGTFIAGEMLDWEAPTGGYLLTGCFATGRAAGQAADRWLSAKS